VSTPGRRALAFGAAGALVAALLLVLERAVYGITFGSDAYSYLVWARDAVQHGTTHHSRFDYTVPKPLELGVAALGQVVGAPLAVFGWFTVLGQLAAVAAVAGLAFHLAGRRAAIAGGVLALALPVLWRGGPAGDSNVPYAALVVAAAACLPASYASAALLGVAGLLRPEAWGLAAIAALLGWRHAEPLERLAALASVIVPPVLWLGLDRVLTGDALWSQHVLDRYDARFHPPHISYGGLATALFHRVDPTLGWPLLAFALAALFVGLTRRPFEPGAIFALALILLLIVQVGRGAVTSDDLGRMLTVLGLLGAAGGAALIGRLPGRLGLLLVLVLCLVFVAEPLRDAFRGIDRQSRAAGTLEQRVGPALRARPPTGLIGVDRAFQGAVALYSGIPRRRIVPLGAIGNEVEACAVGARVRVRPPRVSLAYRSCSG
jgi:hypothetical protein